MPSHLDEFIETIAKLRAPDGCPWDREQTHETLTRYLLEETYEVVEAIHEGNPEKLKEELGDLLLQIVLHAQIASDNGQFDIQDIAKGINKKMISRHPHVFGESPAKTSKEVLKQWDELKESERKNSSDSVIDGVPKMLPALLQALKLSEKAVAYGFEWNNEGEVWEKLYSELKELQGAISHPDVTHPERHVEARREIDLEMGDVLFTLVNIARWHSLNPEESLLLTMEKFKARFRIMEKLAPRPLKELSADEYNDLWEQAKATLSHR